MFFWKFSNSERSLSIVSISTWMEFWNFVHSLDNSFNYSCLPCLYVSTKLFFNFPFSIAKIRIDVMILWPSCFSSKHSMHKKSIFFWLCIAPNFEFFTIIHFEKYKKKRKKYWFHFKSLRDFIFMIILVSNIIFRIILRWIIFVKIIIVIKMKRP